MCTYKPLVVISEKNSLLISLDILQIPLQDLWQTIHWWCSLWYLHQFSASPRTYSDITHRSSVCRLLYISLLSCYVHLHAETTPIHTYHIAMSDARHISNTYNGITPSINWLITPTDKHYNCIIWQLKTISKKTNIYRSCSCTSRGRKEHPITAKLFHMNTLYNLSHFQ